MVSAQLLNQQGVSRTVHGSATVFVFIVQIRHIHIDPATTIRGTQSPEQKCNKTALGGATFYFKGTRSMLN